MNRFQPKLLVTVPDKKIAYVIKLLFKTVLEAELWPRFELLSQ